MSVYIEIDQAKADAEYYGKQFKMTVCNILNCKDIISKSAKEHGLEIVRCKDCRYYQDNNGGYPHPDCKWGNGETPDECDFCSAGERK